MKKLLLLAGLIFVASCQLEDEIPDPRVETRSATVLEDGGVRLAGNISNLQGDFFYGFIISTYEGGTSYVNYDDLFINHLKVKGPYSLDIRNGLVKGQTYYFNAVLNYKGNYILGEEMSFVSNGSASPVINELTPSIAHVGDTINITGEYFSENFKVFFEDIEAQVLLRTDTLARAIVPFDYYRTVPFKNVSIKKSTQETTVFDAFSMYTPKVYSVDPYYAHENDTVTIKGDHFNLVKDQNRLAMDVFGNYTALKIIESSRTELKFINAGWYYELYPKMKLLSQFQTIDINDKFQAKLPTITGTPDCLKYGERVTIYGKDFPRVGSSEFNDQFNLKIGGVRFSPARISSDSIVLKVNDGLYTDFTLNDVVIEYLGESITYEKNICIDEPWLKISTDNPQHQPHNYQNETYGVVYKNNSQFTTIGKFNNETSQFESVLNEPLPEAIHYGSLRTWHEDKMYHYDTSPDVNQFYSYNFLNGNLTELTPFPGEQRVNGLITCIGDYIYLGLGHNNAYEPFDDIWRYSIPNDTWEFMLTYPGISTYQDAITNPLIFAFEDRLFFGGTNPYENSNLFWEIDLNSFSLLPKPNVPVAFASGLKGATLGSKGYFESYYLYEFDLQTEEWSTHENINGIGFMYPESFFESLFIHQGTIYRSVTTSTPYYNLLFKMNMSYLEK